MNSVLNPEAPEFHPLLTNAVQDGLVKVNKTIRTSNSFPVGASYDIYKTYTDFGVITCKISKNVVTQSNQIVITELPQAKLKSDIKVNDDNNTDKIINVNDSLLDRININIDSLSGVNKPSEQFMRGLGAKVSAWNNAPVIAKIKVGDALLIGARNIPRPQLTFKDPVDNSHNLWVPKIFDKPNNMKPLALTILYNAAGEPIGYEHPYSVELGMFEPGAPLLAPAPPPAFPPPLRDTPLTMVDTPPALDDLLAHLRTCADLAVDVEHHSYRSYLGITCLIQITTDEGGDFIIDTLAIREHIYKLNEIFTDPKKVKVFHGAESDVKWLQRDFGVYIVGLFDTYQAGRALRLPALSLKNLLARFCQLDIDKKYQMADWRIRPLPAEMVEYARMDTHYLLYLYRAMRLQLLERAAQQPALLQGVFERSRQTCCLTYSKPVMDEQCHMDLYLLSKRSFNSQQLGALRVLYKWRDQQARELDEGPSYLIPNHMLLNLAERLPRELQGLHAICEPMPPFVKVHALAIHRMILSCRELPPEPVLYEVPSGVRSMMDAQPRPTHSAHDTTHYPDCTEDDINLEMAWALIEARDAVRGVRLDTQPDVAAFAPAAPAAPAVDSEDAAVAPELANRSAGVVSTLNVDAKMFIPPYDRYRCYRSHAQVEEIKDFKDKEAKVAALSRGNALIKSEVLEKLQAQRDGVEAGASAGAEPAAAGGAPASGGGATAPDAGADDAVKLTYGELRAARKASKRKRKMEKAAATQPADDKKKEPQKCSDDHDSKVKSFHYKNVNYKKFFSDDKALKQPKMKFKKP